MGSRDEVRLSKFLSLVLRHRPDEYRLEMDELGFVDLEALIDVLAAEDILGENAEERLEDLVGGSNRRRFEIQDGRIRALYGHSSRIQLNYPEQDPPDFLYHGTTLEDAYRVDQGGLKPFRRSYVHLSSTEDEARSVGGRHTDDPVLIRVDTAKAREAGITFYQATPEIWLCQTLPRDVCELPELPEKPAPRPRPAAVSAPPVGRHEPSSAEPVEPAPEEGGFKRRTRKKSR